MSQRWNHPDRDEVDRVAKLMMAEWERVEGKPVNTSYVATFADMAKVVVADRRPLLERARDAAHAVFDRVLEGDISIDHAAVIGVNDDDTEYQHDCPEDDTCGCESQAAIKLLDKSTREIEAIIGKRPT